MLARPGIVAATSTGEYPARLRAQGAQTIYWDMNLRLRVGTTTEPLRSRDDRGARQSPLRLRGVADPVRDAVDRAQRAERREPRDALDAEQRAVPRQRPQARSRARRAGRAPLPPDQLHAVHRNRRGGDVVAQRRSGLRRRAGGLLQRPLAGRSGPAAREPPPACRITPGRRAARRDRHPGHAHRPDARFPERGRRRWARRAAPARGVVPRRQVAGAGRARDRGRDERRHDVVVGVGDVQRSRARPRQARRRVRLSLGAERAALQRAGEARGGLQRVPRRRPAPTAGHRDVQDRREHDRHERDREAEPRRAGPRRRLQRAARAARRDVRRAR